jgi:hypothetical protein
MEYQEGAVEPRRCAREGDEPIQFKIAEFESNSESRTTYIQIDVQIAYDIRFGRSTYAQKAK